MWRKVQGSAKPKLVDENSSSVYCYVRKDVKAIEKKGEKLYEYHEQKIKKEDWDVYKQIITNTADITDTQEAIGEVLEISDTNSFDITDIQEAVSELMEMIMEG